MISRTTTLQSTLLLALMSAVVLTLNSLPSTEAFAPTRSVQKLSTSTTTTALKEVIEPLEADAVYFDQGSGGVRLAAESALKIVGTVQHKPGSAEAKPSDLQRYTQLTEVEEATVQNTLQESGHSILCSGQGVEFYKDPGETVEAEVKCGPSEAIKDSLQNAGSAMESSQLTMNFLGGDDLVLGQVLEAAQMLTLDLDIPTKCQIAFNSVCHPTIPAGTCTVTVVNMNEDSDVAGNSAVEKAIARGELYLRDGVFYTLQEPDINTADA